MSIETSRSIATRFAAALDADDYDAARPLLAPDCRYEAPKSVIIGPDAILDSYRQASIDGHAKFDRLEYASTVPEVRRDKSGY